MTQFGLALIMGVNGNATIVGTARNLTSASMRRTTGKAEQADGEGNIVAVGYRRPIDTIDIEFNPICTVTSGATVPITAANTPIPSPGAVIVLANMDLAALNGNWNYDGEASATPSSSAALTIRLTLRRANTPDGNGNPTAHAAIS